MKENRYLYIGGLKMNFQTTDLCDDFHEELSICRLPLQSFGGKQKFSGPIYTVDVYEDNVLVLEALESIPLGSVLVVDGKGSNYCALLGDRLAAIGADRGLEGIIINGYVRDSAVLRTLDIGIYALGTMPLKSKKEGKGKRDVMLSFGNMLWEPGNFVYADEDGIVVAGRNILKGK
jgi:regulator of ribonuclease activity A